MRYRTTEVDINKNVYISESYKQYDSNVRYSILLKEDGKDVDLEGCMITAFFKTKSGKIYNKNCTFDKNVVSVILDNNILGESGYVDVEFNIIKDEEIVTTFNIMFEVEKSIDRNGVIIENPQWDILNDIKFIKDSIEIFEPYVLPIANPTVLGGVKVGKGLSIDSNGFLSTIIDRISWSIITDKPTEFNPSQHEHKMDEIADLYIPNVEDVLNSTNTNNSLSANQGRVLSDKISVLQSDSHIHSNKTLLDGITQSKMDEWDNKSNFSGSYNDLTNKPTRLSEFINDGDYTTKTYVDNVITNYQTRIDNTLETTSKEIPSAINEVKALVDDKSDFNGDYNSLANKPTIPTKTSELTNDSTFTTKKYVDDEIVKAVTGGAIDLSDYQTKTDNNLTTTSKEVTGAINELKILIDNTDKISDSELNNLINRLFN